MIAALKALWKGAGLLIGGVPGGPAIWLIGLLAAGAALWIGGLEIELAHARAATADQRALFNQYKADIAGQAARDNAKAIEDMKANQAWQDAALSASLARAQAANAALQSQLTEIRNAPPEQDGPVSAVACAYFSRVWGRPACTAAAGGH